MNFKELKNKLIMARDLMLKNHEYYNNMVFHINRENYIFRGTLSINNMLDFELIQPNKDYIYIHPNIARPDVKFTYIQNPLNYKNPRQEDVSTIDKFCDILGWNEGNIKELNNYLDMYNVKRI